MAYMVELFSPFPCYAFSLFPLIFGHSYINVEIEGTLPKQLHFSSALPIPPAGRSTCAPTCPITIGWTATEAKGLQS